MRRWNEMTQNDKKVIFPAIINKHLNGHIEIKMKGSRGVVIEVYNENNEITERAGIFREELDDVIKALREAKAILDIEEEYNE